MIRRTSFLIVILLIIVTEIYPQQLSHQVIVPLAGIKADNTLNYTQTAGETAVEIFVCYSYVFTQGFQQPGIRLSTGEAPPGTGVKAYPNPAVDNVTIELFGDKARNFLIEFLDITGTVVLNVRKVYDEAYWQKEQIDITNLIRGFYLIRISSEDRIISRTFKIEKI